VSDWLAWECDQTLRRASAQHWHLRYDQGPIDGPTDAWPALELLQYLAATDAEARDAYQQVIKQGVPVLITFTGDVMSWLWTYRPTTAVKIMMDSGNRPP
jgi:hypothetical protein